MNWHSRSYQRKFYFSEKDIDFTTEYLDYHQFLLQEFFKSDNDTRNRIFRYYYEKYGHRSFSYFNNQFDKWSKGNYHLTDYMRDRILGIMPNFLNDEAKHKLEIHEFISSIKKTIKEFQERQKLNNRNYYYLKKPKDIVSLFEKEYINIQKLTLKYFRFNCLTFEEKKEGEEICKYILGVKLQADFNKIEKDINVFLPYISRYKELIKTASYHINLFDLKIDFRQIEIEELTIPKFQIKDLELNSKFQGYSDKYLAYELLSIHKDSNRDIGNAFLNDTELSVFFNHYDALLNGENEVEINSIFKGEGGVLRLNVEITPFKLLKKSIIFSYLKTYIYIILCLLFLLFTIKYKNFFLFLTGFFLIFFFLKHLIIEELDNIKSLREKYRTYGTKQPTNKI